MENREILNEIIKEAEEKHKNLYHDISKEELQTYIKSIKNINNLTEIEFDYEMLKIFALFKDAHTLYCVNNIKINFPLVYIQGKFYLFSGEKWQEVKFFGKLNSEQFYNKMKEVVCFETNEWLNSQINKNINNLMFYKLLGLLVNDTLKIKLVGDKEVLITERAVESKINENFKKEPFYRYEILDHNILYLKYRRCMDIKGMPFVELVKKIKKEIEDKNIKKYILDLRGNIGGNSEILNPFQELVAEKKLKGVLLINNGVFSSGRFAVARFKKHFNTPLIGEPTGGAIKSYGNALQLKVGDKGFCVSTKQFDFKDIFGYEGAIQPDILIERTISDLQNNYDKQLNFAIFYLENNFINEKECIY